MKDLKSIIEKIYNEDSDLILKEIDPYFKGEGKQQLSSWHKSFNLYVAYPDTFIDKNGECSLKTLKNKLSYIKNLGMDAVHILPFLKSPMIDLGFDISNYQKVRRELGGNKALEELLEEAEKLNIKIFMDLVFNHVSIEHDWFKKAEGGNKKYRKFFICSRKKPKLLKREKTKKGHWATYKTQEGEVSHRIIFPEFAGEIPHWIKAKDGYWYYHTFYPSQIDLNWNNPQVFIEFFKILHFWAKKGLNFRLDAVTFMGKDVVKGPIESNGNLHHIIQALNILVKRISPESVFLVETSQPVNTIKKYFGTDILESELAYNFNLMNSLWSSILNNKVKSIWTSIKYSFKDLPPWASWVNFLRNHDELTLEFASERQRKNLLDLLEMNGMEFREGFGIAGRTASFLNKDPKRIAMAHMLLASLPGNPAIIYGDELGKINEDIPEEERLDARNINRGKIKGEDIKNKKNRKIYKKLSKIFNKRREVLHFFKEVPKKIEDDKSIFSAVYEDYKKRELEVHINLSKEEKIVKTKNNDIGLRVNNVKRKSKKVVLGPYAGVWLT